MIGKKDIFRKIVAPFAMLTATALGGAACGLTDSAQERYDAKYGVFTNATTKLSDFIRGHLYGEETASDGQKTARIGRQCVVSITNGGDLDFDLPDGRHVTATKPSAKDVNYVQLTDRTAEAGATGFEAQVDDEAARFESDKSKVEADGDSPEEDKESVTAFASEKIEEAITEGCDI